MANRIEATFSGLDSLNKVAAAHKVESLDNPGLGKAIDMVLDGIKYCDSEDGDPQVSAALACAILNRQFERSGWLLKALEDGKLCVDFKSSDEDRRTILQLLAD